MLFRCFFIFDLIKAPFGEYFLFFLGFLSKSKERRELFFFGGGGISIVTIVIVHSRNLFLWLFVAVLFFVCFLFFGFIEFSKMMLIFVGVLL